LAHGGHKSLRFLLPHAKIVTSFEEQTIAAKQKSQQRGSNEGYPNGSSHVHGGRGTGEEPVAWGSSVLDANGVRRSRQSGNVEFSKYSTTNK
jgi:hypothetical protein